MQFTTVALSALSVASVLAQEVKVHVVRVGALNGTLAYFPNKLTAAVGEMVQFQFAPANHTVTQSTFDNPCAPIADHSNITGIYSGFMPVSANSEMTPIFTIQINDTKPIWLYCSKGQHCQNGMTMVINENTSANASRSLEAYQAAAKLQTQNLAPGTPVTNGTSGTVDSGNDAFDPTATDGVATPSSTSASPTAEQTPGSSASSLSVPALAGVLAMVFAFAL